MCSNKTAKRARVSDKTPGFQCLTEKGVLVAQKVYERYDFFLTVFANAGISKETAVKDACRLEHDISEESFRKLKCALM